jgi:phage-related holin
MQYAITACFIAIDVLSGSLYAIMRHQWTSTKMRVGLFHKMAIILFIVLAILCDFGQQYLALGFKLPIAKSVCIYVILMEIGSTGENIINLNPALKTKVKAIFKTK